jgi:glycosyltransferase involved in cell wall biosynthesis
MNRRLTVGLPFVYQESWIGGLYHTRNVVSALALLPDAQRPRLLVIGEERQGYDYLRAETGYPDLTYAAPREVQRDGRSLNPLRRRPSTSDTEIDVFLLGAPPALEARSVLWIPDFQEERFPQFFSAKELSTRRKRNARWLARHRHVMVSSEDVRGELERHYGRYRNRVHVVPFATFIDNDLAQADPVALRATYALPARYFICTNQLWRHKNHGVILHALAGLAADETVPPVVMTGAEHDYRDRAYAPSVRALADELGVAERVRFLGMLPRADQLGLTAGAIAVIQPSLCEGWSTVVEEAKATGKHVLASDIAVHREQLDRNVDFFKPDDPSRLSELIRRYAAADPLIEPLDYQANKRRFAEQLIAMLTEAEADFRARRVMRAFSSASQS